MVNNKDEQNNKYYDEDRSFKRYDIECPSKPKERKNELFELLAGTWTSEAQGWNLIALPVGPKKFRLLMNQYGETLKFGLADLCVPNRGAAETAPDQHIDAIAYEQIIVQKAVADFPATKLIAPNGNGIHHEPGFFLQLLDHVTKGHTEEVKKGVLEKGDEVKLTIARQASIPHGNSVLAMGTIRKFDGPPKTGTEQNPQDMNPENATPERIKDRSFITNSYLAPYKHFEDNHFLGNVEDSKKTKFPGLFPKDANAILKFALSKFESRVKKTTVLHFDTKYRNKNLTNTPISNIPFVQREANVTEMHADFWIMELDKHDESEPTEFIMQYSQTVYLEFFESDDKDEKGKLIRWPHVSINTLRKT